MIVWGIRLDIAVILEEFHIHFKGVFDSAGVGICFCLKTN